MQMKWIAPSTLTSARFAEARAQEGGELARRHLARGHGELAVLDPARAADVAVDLHVVGRIGEDHPRLLAVHQPTDDVGVERVAADQPVRPELPDIARPAARRPGLGQPVVLGIAGLLRRQPLDQAVDLRDREAGHADVEAEIVGEERLQLFGEQVLVPAGVQRQLVVGEHVGPLLGRGHGLDADAGHRRHAEELRRLDPAMAGEDGVLGVSSGRR